MPRRERKTPRPSGRVYGPEKRMRAFFECLARGEASRVARWYAAETSSVASVDADGGGAPGEYVEAGMPGG